jgi:FixJ family two-component response regulator
MNSNTRFVIFLVDDDKGVLKGLSTMLRAKGFEVEAFSSAADFLSHHDRSVPGCAIFDVSMPDLDGIELQRALLARGAERPVIFITGVGDIPTSVQAMKVGAVDFLTKPVRSQQLLQAIAAAKERELQTIASREELSVIRERLATLTPREHEVLTHVIAGRLNKQIAAELGTVEKTIKMHRGRMMHKLGVRAVVDLVRIADRVGIRPSQPRHDDGGLKPAAPAE